MDNISISNILSGTTPWIVKGQIQIQTAGYMQIIPLVSDLVDDRFGPPEVEVGTSHYGELDLKNSTNKTVIVPSGAGYITKQRAQDHATPTAKLIKARETAHIVSAACIQSTQGGTIRPEKTPLTILPFMMREESIQTRKKKEYSKLWEAIGRFNQDLGLRNTSQHLEFYLQKFKDQLDEFVAQFELVPKQIGAIVLINGNVVGIERAPNYEVWRYFWNPLVRESYGSLAVKYAKMNAEAIPYPGTRQPMRRNKITDLESLEKELNWVKSKEAETVTDLIRKFVNDPFKTEQDEKIPDGFSTITVSHKQFVGQIIAENERILYASLVTTQDWMKNSKWYMAEKFKI